LTFRERRKHVRIQRQFEARLFNFEVKHEPHSFTDRDKIFRLRGNEIVRLVDKRDQGLAVEFSRDLQEFEKVEHTEIAVK